MYKNQIDILLRIDKKVSTIFQGVHACNNLHNVNLKTNKPSIVIVNTAPDTESGSHWILFFRPMKGKNMVFFDSFAKSPKDYGECLENAVKYFASFTNNPYKLVLSKKVLQLDDSAVCGLYCIFAGYHFARGKTINSLEKNFTNNKAENDQIICKWFKTYFHSKIPPYCKTDQKCICAKKWKK